MLFKNITSETLKCYGYEFKVGGPPVDVTDPALIRKFTLFHQLAKMDTGDEPKVADIEFETLKSQAIAAGMKTDGRWSNKRLIKEVQEYISNA